MNGLFHQLNNVQDNNTLNLSISNINFSNIESLCLLFANSLLCGLILSVVTFYMAKSLTISNESFSTDKDKDKDKDPENNNKKEKKTVDYANLFLGSANILFLCVGLTGVMILVNNNLARAFAIGAALTITRFRVKVGPKILASNLLFGVIIGVANGLSEMILAWLLTIIYVFLELILLFIAKKYYVVNQEK
ncbi:MAG: hypothetical protein HQK49_15240 [Oligoflexia bacterium]|nr:hypothetical protein [Oligoflexia bacterium]